MSERYSVESLTLHPDCRIRVEHVGAEREPVLVIDNVIAEAMALAEFAATQSRFLPVKGLYPGIRAPAPPAYIQALHSYLREPLCETFALQASDIRRVESDYSLVTTAPEQLHPLQRLPHFDSHNRRELAMIHYLCSPQCGGTSFYRHRDTGYEFIDASRRKRYFTALEQQTRAEGLPAAAYINGSTSLFEQVASFEAAFNRALIYRCTSLHSGDIPAGFNFDPRPRTGRLSINSFLLGD